MTVRREPSKELAEPMLKNTVRKGRSTKSHKKHNFFHFKTLSLVISEFISCLTARVGFKLYFFQFHYILKRIKPLKISKMSYGVEGQKSTHKM